MVLGEGCALPKDALFLSADGRKAEKGYQLNAPVFPQGTRAS